MDENKHHAMQDHSEHMEPKKDDRAQPGAMDHSMHKMEDTPHIMSIKVT